jgi:hypothetical protein
MRWLLMLIALPVATLAICPLGKPPEDACPVVAPECLLFVDADGDGYCDNPGPRAAPVDTLDAEVEQPTDSTEAVVDGLPPEDIEEIGVEDSAGLESDGGFTEPDSASHIHDPDAPVTDTLSVDVSIEISGDSVSVDTLITEEISVPLRPCPLQLPPAEACAAEAPRCLFYNDTDSNGFCNNPLFGLDTLVTEAVEVHDTTYVLVVDTLSGCPLSLPPEAACPSLESRLCPHFQGSADACVNPSGGGMTRAIVVLAGTALLLPVSTCLRKRLHGRKKSERRRRTAAHVTVHLLSLAVLGFFVQGCYCQLGVIQYFFLPGGLGFLGGVGIAILVLPMVWALFFGRIFCGWVCPFGALQDLLGKLNVPRPPRLPVRLRRYLVYQKFALSVLFFTAVYLSGRGLLGRVIPGALLCQIDPFHTVFTFFMLGSFFGGVALLVGLIFLPRFFCQYLCFYGTVLSFLGRARLFRRLTGKRGRIC